MSYLKNIAIAKIRRNIENHIDSLERIKNESKDRSLRIMCNQEIVGLELALAAVDEVAEEMKS